MLRLGSLVDVCLPPNCNTCLDNLGMSVNALSLQRRLLPLHTGHDFVVSDSSIWQQANTIGLAASTDPCKDKSTRTLQNKVSESMLNSSPRQLTGFPLRRWRLWSEGAK